MALSEHIEILRHGVENWNRWRKEAQVLPDLRGANLRGADLRGIHLQEANLQGANLRGADLRAADPLDTDPWGPKPRAGGGPLHAPSLWGTNLVGDAHILGSGSGFWGGREGLVKAGGDRPRANLWAAELWAANLDDANLRGADLCDSNLRGTSFQNTDLQKANLRGADLRDSNLWATNLHGADLEEADLRSAKMGLTLLNGLDLSLVNGLETIHHLGPSSVDLETLERTARSVLEQKSRREKIEAFYRCAGVTERVLQLFHAEATGPDYHPCFISYSNADKAFARWLYEQLQAYGVRCWLHEHEALEDDDSYGMVDGAVRLWDRVLFCCSKTSMTSWWVETEIEHAQERERLLLKQYRQKTRCLIGLNLDGYLFEKKWKRSRERHLKSRLIADFSGWQKRDAKLEIPLEQVLRSLKIGPAAG